ncbi:MAG: class II fumarate hydratase [Opitutaceae bacterium]
MRKENDSMGEMNIPDDALYGASTQRAVLNFPISGHRMPHRFIQAMGLIKHACAQANGELNLLEPEKVDWISRIGLEIFEGALADQFPVDVFQTGSGTSTNMNVNEVIANRASVLAGLEIGSKQPIHPNDDCNMGQSSNDVVPTALHVSVAIALWSDLRPALAILRTSLEAKAQAYDQIVKVGRTHLMDATPMTVGQELSGFAAQVMKAIKRVDRAIEALQELAIGGTAVGTGLNRHPEFPAKVVTRINEKTALCFREAENHFEAQSARDDCVEVAGQLTAVCACLTKIANDVRLLGSGPRCGLGEYQLPATQPGSSIMPGKVNPVMSEMLVQVCLYVQGLCQTVAMCGRDGQLQLNVTMPLIAYALHESVRCLSHGAQVFAERCVDGLEVNEEQVEANLQRSLMLVTALNSHIGYDQAARVAKKAYETGKTLREVVLQEGLLDEVTLDRALDPSSMTRPQ